MTQPPKELEDGGPDTAMLDAEVVGMVRDAAKEAINTNCTFVDDDLRVLCHLACRAIDAGLTDELPESIQRRIAARSTVKEAEDG